MSIFSVFHSHRDRAFASDRSPIHAAGCARTRGCRRSTLPVIAGLAMTLLLWAAGAGLAQTVDTTLWVTNGTFRGVVRDGGMVYIGGSFTVVGPATGTGVAIDAGSGAIQQPYPRVVGQIDAVAPDGSDGWYLAG